MKYNKTIAAHLGSMFAIDVSVRTEKVAKIHRDKRGADLAYVNVKLSFTVPEGNVELAELQFLAKTSNRPNQDGGTTGRWIETPTQVGSDRKRRPAFGVSGELRAAICTAVFAHPRIAQLAEYAEAQLVSSAPAQSPQSSSLQQENEQLRALVDRLLGERTLEDQVGLGVDPADDLEQDSNDNPFEQRA